MKERQSEHLEDLMDADTMQKFALEDMLAEQKARNEWYSELQSCRKLIVHWTTNGFDWWYYTFMMETAPLVVWIEYPTAGNNPQDRHPLWNIVDWDFVEVADAPYDTDSTTTLNAFFGQFYKDNGKPRLHTNPLEGGTGYTQVHYVLSPSYSAEQYYKFGKGVWRRGKSQGTSQNLDYAINKSEAEWPELPGYNTQYVDNIGVFVPANYLVDQNLTMMLVKLCKDYYPAFQAASKCVILRKATPAGNFAEVQGMNLVNELSAIPFVGIGFSFANTMIQYGNTQQLLLWPRIYAFGRNSTVTMVRPEEMQIVLQRYNQQSSSSMVPRLTTRMSLVQDLVKLLIEKSYINASQAGGWT